MVEERRKYERVILDKQVSLSGPEDQRETRLVDISLKGVLLEEPEGWEPAENVDYFLTLPLGEGGKPKIKMQMRIAHREDNHVGFTWKQIDAESFDHLRKLLSYNLNDSGEIERELHTMFEQR